MYCKMKDNRFSRCLKIYARIYAEKPAIICDDEYITFSKLFFTLEEHCERLVKEELSVVYIKNERSIETVINILAAACLAIPYRIVDKIPKEPEELPKSTIPGRTIMYYIQTSGTTGEKKLVIRFLDDFISFMDSYVSRTYLKKSDVILNQLDFSFDAAAKDIFGMARSGATLVIGNREKLNYPTEFLNTIKRYSVTHFQTTPFFIKCMAKLDAFANEAPDLKKVLFVGDVMKSKYINYWIEKIPDAIYFNLYGVSEYAGNPMVYRTRKPVVSEYVPLDTSWQNKAHIQEDGEMILGDYHTGDYFQSLISKKRDCSSRKKYVFAYRRDNLRKIRGYRINLEEIERAMCKVDGIEDAICEIADDEIYALYEGKDDVKENKKLLKSLLPEYCQPVHLKPIDNLPVNDNGKADRKKILEWFE